ncbi:MAG: endonuclease III [Syntrophomonadaceae bacterium]|nr:endonuclease III [Syntrophomonadaceae bacterium]
MSRILKDLEQEFPQADTRLQFDNVFELLIATILSAQTTDEQVNTITENLFKRYNTPQDFVGLMPSELEPLINGCGLFRNKARSIIGASQMILERFGGQVPDSMEELMELPGVGRKTANVMLSVGFGKPGLAVDTHVQRVSRRLGFAEDDNPEHTERILKSLIEPHKWGRAHHLIIGHGRTFCRAKKPKCYECPIAYQCPGRPT